MKPAFLRDFCEITDMTEAIVLVSSPAKKKWTGRLYADSKAHHYPCYHNI